ncbi:IS256 family transposase, partial [Micromonospora sp. AMSO12t]|uniref:IS256 family transposase n=1 Tax=Micromonospora sp. AMSO12t TaxID=2650410 RepID=UPI00139E564C
RGLRAELRDHLGYAKHDPAGKGSGNSRNGSTAKTVQTEIGPVEVKVPRDRAGTFTPMLLPKNARRLGGLSDVVISVYAGGMTVRDIAHHLHRVYGTEVGPDTISTITDEVLDEVKTWQQRPLDEVYPIVYVDCLMVKVRDGGTVRNKACYLV